MKRKVWGFALMALLTMIGVLVPAQQSSAFGYWHSGGRTYHFFHEVGPAYHGGHYYRYNRPYYRGDRYYHRYYRY